MHNYKWAESQNPSVLLKNIESVYKTKAHSASNATPREELTTPAVNSNMPAPKLSAHEGGGGGDFVKPPLLSARAMEIYTTGFRAMDTKNLSSRGARADDLPESDEEDVDHVSVSSASDEGQQSSDDDFAPNATMDISKDYSPNKLASLGVSPSECSFNVSTKFASIMKETENCYKDFLNKFENPRQCEPLVAAADMQSSFNADKGAVLASGNLNMMMLIGLVIGLIFSQGLLYLQVLLAWLQVKISHFRVNCCGNMSYWDVILKKKNKPAKARTGLKKFHLLPVMLLCDLLFFIFFTLNFAFGLLLTRVPKGCLNYMRKWFQ